MCLYPRLMKNPKYRINKKNGGEVPVCEDMRVLYVPVGCEECIECRKQKAGQWRTRLLEEIRVNSECTFITLTFSDEWIAKIANGYKNEKGLWVEGIGPEIQGYDLDNEIATRAMRGFLERWRRLKGKSLRHWFSTEIGGHGSENIHMHGIVWTKDIDTVRERWGYGFVWDGEGESYVNDSTVGYITKYLNKVDIQHRGYKSKILTSAGIGANYVKRVQSMMNEYKGADTDESYRSRSGKKGALPIYYRNKLYTEEQREKLWLVKLDKQQRFVLGEKIDVSKGDEVYEEALKYARRVNREFGFGGEELSEEEYEYNKNKRNIAILTRIAKGEEKRKNGGDA